MAATLKVGISNYVATSALAVLAGAAALFTYVSQNYTPPWEFFAAMIAAAVCLVISIVLGGDGADLVVSQVASGKWRNARAWQFNWQAILTLIGLILVLIATAIGVRSARIPASAGTSGASVTGHLQPQLRLLATGCIAADARGAQGGPAGLSGDAQALGEIPQ